MTAAIGAITVTDHDGDGTWLIALEGEHDISTTPLIEEQTSGVWPDFTIAVVDLSAAAFIDCSVVNWLLRTRDALVPSRRDALRIVGARPDSAAARLFDLPSLRDVFPCYPTRQKALAPAAAGPADAGGRAPFGAAA